jgi:hypothetical protein
MLIPTTPMTPPMISTPSRIVKGSRMPSRLLTFDGPRVSPT